MINSLNDFNDASLLTKDKKEHNQIKKGLIFLSCSFLLFLLAVSFLLSNFRPQPTSAEIKPSSIVSLKDSLFDNETLVLPQSPNKPNQKISSLLVQSQTKIGMLQEPLKNWKAYPELKSLPTLAQAQLNLALPTQAEIVVSKNPIVFIYNKNTVLKDLITQTHQECFYLPRENNTTTHKLHIYLTSYCFIDSQLIGGYLWVPTSQVKAAENHILSIPNIGLDIIEKSSDYSRVGFTTDNANQIVTNYKNFLIGNFAKNH